MVPKYQHTKRASPLQFQVLSREDVEDKNYVQVSKVKIGHAEPVQCDAAQDEGVLIDLVHQDTVIYGTTKHHCDVCNGATLADERISSMKNKFVPQEAGLEIEYRCVRCRDCPQCRDAHRTEKTVLERILSLWKSFFLIPRGSERQLPEHANL